MKKAQKKPSSNKTNELNELFSELKSEYLEAFPEKIISIENYGRAKIVEPWKMNFTKMKGTGTTYGVEDVSKVAEIMEAMCYQGHPHLGFGVLLSLELFKKIRHHSMTNATYALDKDKLFKALRKMYDQLESA